MREQFVDRFCAALRETERTTPFGDETVIWTVRGHTFAAYTVDGDGVSVRVGNKVAAQKLVGQGRVATADYLRGNSWVLFPWDTSPDELRLRIGASHSLVIEDGTVA